MDEQEARQRLAASGEATQFVEEAELRPLENGGWLAARPKLPECGVVIKADGTLIRFSGALGKLVPKFGLPVSPERRLGSARQGQYQVYEGGLGIWEALKEIGDIGFPIARWNAPGERARSCCALVAFFDLRGFTQWSTSAGVDAGVIQEVIENIERAFPEAFRGLGSELFAKGTGDGFMVVSEASWYDPSTADVQPGHAVAFCRACAETVRSAMKEIPNKLATGCGITTGKITQLYLLGRFDYIGPKINEASKIQAVAYNELCIAPEVMELLEKGGEKISGWPLPGKGMRVSADEFGSA